LMIDQDKQQCLPAPSVGAGINSLQNFFEHTDVIRSRKKFVETL